ncbi:hypothetical protein BDBG_04256 [Blastomyces gilchristii SLH14081]|uniref:Protein kinase domain-containing protein n=1 Tax=Blastomyces gilchristii (strain SLH14081) TaxID=559298 RepID=A0A179UJY0_BLAGS|nr:uncharacterized protein BDBG_04256 [Blastomyces gilchristii SLH14081]OAT08294.1 hypothetical protein BDBG_04256 [Blastomyces gilchristii SLH14081]
MVDVVPPPSDVEPQTMVLEAFEKSLCSARSIAIGLGLYTTRISFIQVCCRERDLTLNRHYVPDLKMENVLVNGFDNKSPGSGERLVTKIANLGTAATDIWPWGIYLHLLQAHINFKKPGMFDSLEVEGTLTDKENVIRAAMAQEFSLHAIEYYNSNPVTRQLLPPKDETRTEHDHWVVKLFDKNIPEKDIETAPVALNPVPELRPSALDLLKYGYI